MYLVNIVNLHNMYRRVYPEVTDEILYKNCWKMFSRKLARQKIGDKYNKGVMCRYTG